MKNFAYLTLATNKHYLQKAYNLYKSYLKTNSKYPFYCMIWKETDISDYKDLPIIIISKIFKEQTENSIAPGPGVFSKICVWELTQFSYCCFLDSDNIFLKNADKIIDNYIQKYDDCIVCDIVKKTQADDPFINGQWFFTKPNLKTFFKAMKYFKISAQDEILLTYLCLNNEIKFIFDAAFHTCIFHANQK